MWQRDKAGVPVRGSDGAPVALTSHTLNPVPFSVYSPDRDLRLAPGLEAAGIASVGTTFVDLLGAEVPEGWQPSLLAR
jgi:2,3-bisphosphoglycerate-independent phosphoglycerate mutase